MRVLVSDSSSFEIEACGPASARHLHRQLTCQELEMPEGCSMVICPLHGDRPMMLQPWNQYGTNSSCIPRQLERKAQLPFVRAR